MKPNIYKVKALDVGRHKHFEFGKRIDWFDSKAAHRKPGEKPAREDIQEGIADGWIIRWTGLDTLEATDRLYKLTTRLKRK